MESWGPVEPLGEALHFLRMNGAFYCRSELSAPWGLTLPPMAECLSFHVVMSGRCLLNVEGLAAVVLMPGDLALVPHAQGHQLLSEQGAPAPRIDELPYEVQSERYAILHHGGGGAPTSLVCGDVRFDHPSAQHLVKMLPRVIHIQANGSAQMEWIQSTIRFMAAEAKELRPGGETVVTRLADILVIQAIRTWLQSDSAAQMGWLGALQDKQIGRAIMLIHRELAREWSLEALAREVAMSRSAFAARFTQLVGEPAMQYVARHRMTVATAWLREERTTISDLAERLGYRSEAAFSRAYKRVMGRSPGRARAAH